MLITLVVNIIPVISVVYIVVAINLLKNNFKDKFIYFPLFLFANAIYSFFYFLELNSTSLESMITIRNFEFLGVCFIPSFVILFVSELTKKKISFLKKYSMYVLSTTIWFLFITNPSHNLFYKKIEIFRDKFSASVTEKNIVYYVLLAYYGIALIVSSINIYKSYKKEQQIKRKSNFLFLFVTFQIAWLTIFFIVSGLDKYVDPTPWVLMIVCCLFVINEVINDMFELRVNSWRNTFLNMGEAAFLINSEKDIICANIVSTALFSQNKQNIKDIVAKLDTNERINTPISFIVDNEKRWYAIKKNIIDIRRKFTSYLLIDITETINAQEKMKRTAKMLSESQKVAHIGSYVNNIHDDYWTCSEELDRIFGIDASYPHTNNGWINIVHPEFRDELFEYTSKVYAQRLFFDKEYKIVRLNDGQERWVHGLGRLEFDENEAPLKLIGTIQDITERKLKDEEIIFRSNHDFLTGIFNRRKLEEIMEDLQLKGKTPISVIIGDVNGLKLVNDAYGHTSGDIVLKKIARILIEVFGESAYIARQGGDEFVILLPDVGYEESCAKIVQIKERCIQESKDELILNITFGVSTKISKDETLEHCQNIAEERMYTSKLLESKNVRSSIVENLRIALEEKSGETRNHCIRIAEMSDQIGKMMGIHGFELENLKLLAIFHDIGKTGVPGEILLKTKPLNKNECPIIQKHSEIGYRIANTIPELIPIADGILSHHERWDGKGYPQELKGEEIPLLSRIVSVLDAYDAMTNDRPYRKAMSKEMAIAEIKKCAGEQFDPNVVEAFVKYIEA
jgi:diguanylate cyclase (GGDEF)-like protein/PAS domain S-box-containing protein